MSRTLCFSLGVLVLLSQQAGAQTAAAGDNSGSSQSAGAGANAGSPQPAQHKEAQVPLNCSDFQRNTDGSWSPLHEVMIAGPTGSVSVGPATTFQSGVSFMGVQVVDQLNAQCAPH